MLRFCVLGKLTVEVHINSGTKKMFKLDNGINIFIYICIIINLLKFEDMKKLLLFIPVLILFLGCEKNEPEPKDTTYAINSVLTEISGVTFGVTIFEYNEQNEKINSNTIPNFAKGTKKTFIANSLTKKVKIYMSATNQTTELRKWVQQVYYLIPNDNLNIIIRDDTMVGSSEP